MTIFRSKLPWVEPPANLTLPQFMLDDLHAHPTRPDRLPNLPCVIEEESRKEVSFEELRSRTDSLARGLSAKFNIGDGDIVALFSANHLDFVVCVWAVHRLGGAVATMNPAMTVDELVHQLRTAKPTLLITHSDILKVALDAAHKVGLSSARIAALDAERLPPSARPTSIEALIQEGPSLPPFKEYILGPGEGKRKMAFLCFSSGTTGNPKAVAMSHYNLLCDIVQGAAMIGVNERGVSPQNRRTKPGDVGCAVLPLYHIYGFLSNFHVFVYSWVTTVLTCKFNFEKFLQSIERNRITHLMLVPPHVVLFCKHPATKKYDLSSVRFCMAGAAPITADLTEQFLRVFPSTVLGQGFGMSETSSLVTVFPTDQKIGTLGSAGQLVPGTIAKVVKPDGSLAGYGEPGELWVHGGQVTLGYYMNEQATKETFIDGWAKSGDEVYFEENGDMFVTDRIKEFIKVRGFQVAPAELEGHLLSHPDVADAGVIGIADEYSGEVPLAFIVLHADRAAQVDKDPQLAAEIRASISKHVADSKSKTKWLAGGVAFIDAVPKTPSGKILRRMLRDKAKSLPVRARL